MNMKSITKPNFVLAVTVVFALGAAWAAAESNDESAGESKSESRSRYRSLTVGFDWGSIASKSSSGGPFRFHDDTALRNQFSLLRIGYSSHRGGKGIVGYGYNVNIGISLSGNHWVTKGPRSVYLNNPNVKSYSYGFGRQIHLGQFFGVSFRIIDAPSIRWFAAIGLSMDIMVGLPFTTAMNIFRSDIALGPQLNSYVTYMFNPSFGLSLGGNFTLYLVDVYSALGGRSISASSGGFGVFCTFAR